MKRMKKLWTLLLAALFLTTCLMGPVGVAAAEVYEGYQFSSLAHGDYFALALDADGSVWSWGANNYGQLGTGTMGGNSGHNFMKAVGVTNTEQIAAGQSFSSALKSDGTVWCWGQNAQGQLGNGTTTDQPRAVQAKGLSNVSAIYAGAYHMLALKQDGTVWSWGYNSHGQLGNGNTSNRSSPAQVPSLSDIKSIAANSWSSLALTNDGLVYAWGRNDYGELGNGSSSGSASTPQQISGLTDVQSIDGNLAFYAALKNDGTVWYWGEYPGGAKVTRPTQITGLSDVVDISVGSRCLFALDSSGQYWFWGWGRFSGFGEEVISDLFNTPVAIETPYRYILPSRSAHTNFYGIDSENRIWGWGEGRTAFAPGSGGTQFTPILLFGPGTWVGPGIDPTDPPDPIKHDVTVIERYRDGSLPDNVIIYEVPDGAAFSESYTMQEGYQIHSIDLDKPGPQVGVNFSDQTIAVSEINQPMTITLTFQEAGVIVEPPEPADEHTITITETYADDFKPDRVVTRTVEDGQGFYYTFTVPEGYTAEAEFGTAPVNFNPTGAVHVASVEQDIDIVITFTPEE